MTTTRASTFSDPALAALAARFPLEIVTVTAAMYTWRISCVTDQDALLDGVNEVEHVPYGFLLWESAVALARWLVQHRDQVTGRRVLELGAGVGLAGLAAQQVGATVWQTDHRTDVLLLAAHNARQNGLTPSHQFVADWRAWDHDARYDLLLGADILYERAMHPHLAPIFRRNLAPGGRLLLTDPSRPQALELIAQMETDGWQVTLEMQPITLALPNRENKVVQVAVLTCWWD
ncbi:MAG: methyltransferase domain-containing protein [Caldilineaceae bacterium]